MDRGFCPLRGITRVSVTNGISFRPMASAWCVGVTDGETDRQTDR